MDSGHSNKLKNKFDASLSRIRLANHPSILAALKLSKNLDYNHPGLSSKIYLNHPIRVANLLIENISDVSYQHIVTALLHNVVELTNIKRRSLDQYFEPAIVDCLYTLNVDRTRQDQILYKKEYYKSIENTSEICVLIKLADKLDNIYMINFNPILKRRTIYLDEIKDFVIPLAEKYCKRISSYLKRCHKVALETNSLDKQIETDYAIKLMREGNF